MSAGVRPAVATQAPGSVVGDDRVDCSSGAAAAWADPPQRHGDQVVPGVVGAAGDPHGALCRCSCWFGGWFVVAVLAGGGHGVLLVGVLVGARRSSGGPITAVIGGQGQGAVRRGSGCCWSGRVDSRRSEAGERIHPGGSGGAGTAAALGAGPYPPTLVGPPEGQRVAPHGAARTVRPCGPVDQAVRSGRRPLGGRPVRSLHFVGGVALRPVTAQSGSRTASLTALGAPPDMRKPLARNRFGGDEAGWQRVIHGSRQA
jgi:hypothetical protein